MSIGTTSAFIAKLLAPIALGDEQADTPQFRKELLHISQQIWIRHKQQVDRATMLHMAEAIRQRNMPGSHPLDSALMELYSERKRCELAQCLIPAPTMVEVRWKKRIYKGFTMPAEVAAAIAADEARLAKMEG